MTIHIREPRRSSSVVEPTRAELLARYRLVRETTERLCAPLETEDYVAQSMPDASPVKWHLAHTTWFFETFLLKPSHDGQGVAPAEYAYLFNSYYNALGERIARPHRGLLTRPTVAEVYRYRAQVDEEVEAARIGRRAGLPSARAAGRARLEPRAAAPGADPHRPEAPLRRQSGPPRLPRVSSAARSRALADAMGRRSGGTRGDWPRGTRVCL